MSFFKNKEEMFNHRAKQFENSRERYEKKGNIEKADWASEQIKHNQSQAEKYKGQEGWK